MTRSQFRQCLTMLELNCTDEEMTALEAKFCNDVGFNYLAFLEELEPMVSRDAESAVGACVSVLF